MDKRTTKKFIENALWSRRTIFNCDARLLSLFVVFAQANLCNEVEGAVMETLNECFVFEGKKENLLEKVIDAAAEAMRDKYEELTDVGCGSYLLITNYNGEKGARWTEWHLAPNLKQGLEQVVCNLDDEYKGLQPGFSMWQGGKLVYSHEKIMEMIGREVKTV